MQLGWAEAVNVDGWKVASYVSQQFLIPLQLEAWMQSTLHQDLIPTQRHSLADFGQKLFAWQDIPLGTLGRAVERAEVTNGGANIGVIDVPIDVVRSVWLRMKTQRHFIRGATYRGQVMTFEQSEGILG
jgi:hypothetical protein